MLHHFYETEKAKGKEIYATYYISGLVSGANKLPSTKEQNDGSILSFSPPEVVDSYLVMLCQDSNLDESIKEFTKIYSIHIYALSPSPMTNYDPLAEALNESLKDKQGRTPVE